MDEGREGVEVSVRHKTESFRWQREERKEKWGEGRAYQDHVRLGAQPKLNGTIRDTTDKARRDSTESEATRWTDGSNHIAPQAWRRSGQKDRGER